MLVALLSDIHANQHALDAVLASTAAAGVDQYWFLGDAVGYGPDPAAVLQWLRGDLGGVAAPAQWVLGNHDAMLSDLADVPAATAGPMPPGFQVGMDAAGNMLWASGAILSQNTWERTHPNALHVIARHRADLAGIAAGAISELFTRERKMPVRVCQDGVEFVLVHSGQVDNLLRYIYAWQEQQFLPDEFRLLAVGRKSGVLRVQCFGHTHVPTLVQGTIADTGVVELHATEVVPGITYSLGNNIWLLNPGSVGQPRDLCTCAAYALLDTEARSVTFRRVKYLVHHTILRMQINDYPQPIIGQLKSAHADQATPAGWLEHYAVAAGVGCG